MKRARDAVAHRQGQKPRHAVSEDGYVRMSLPELLSLSLTHYLSGLDEDFAERVRGGVIQTTISGYTEWLSQGEPVVTVGWDWRLNLTPGVPSYVRDDLPRSNLMLVDAFTQQDLGDEATAASLARLIDQSDWTDDAAKHIRIRYASRHRFPYGD